MKRKRHNPEQIIRKLRTAEQLLNQGQSIADVCRALEVSAPTYHRWQQLYGGMKATEAKRLKELEQENTSGSWPVAMCAGAAGWFTGGCGWMAGASITSGCNGFGERRGCSGPCRASGSVQGPQVDPGSY